MQIDYKVQWKNAQRSEILAKFKEKINVKKVEKFDKHKRKKNKCKCNYLLPCKLTLKFKEKKA
jgi:hypothetical protein